MKTPAILKYLGDVERQSNIKDPIVMRTAIGLGCILSAQGEDAGRYHLLVSGEFKNLFDDKLGVKYLHDLMLGCFERSYELEQHINGEDEPTDEIWDKAQELGIWTLRLATLVGEGYARIATNEELADPEEPENKSMQMLRALYQQNTLPKAVPTHSIMEQSNEKH